MDVGSSPGIAAGLVAWNPPAGTIGVQWLGQAGFALRGQRDLVLVDPFLSERPDRLAPPVDVPGNFTGLTAVLATHEHADHLDLRTWPALSVASPEARFVVPAPLVDRVAASGIDRSRVVGARPAEDIDIGGARVRALPARHGVTTADAYSFGEALSGGQIRFLGYVVEIDGVRVYHSGDTIRYPEQAQILRDLEPDLLLLPVNGRDAEREARGLVGNLEPEEAAELAADVGTRLVVPMHYELMAGNLGDVGRFVAALRAAAPQATAVVLGRHQRMLVPGPG